MTEDKNDLIDSGQEDDVVSDGNSSTPTAECLFEPKSEGLSVMDGTDVEDTDGHIDTINKRRKICTEEEPEENNSEISVKSFPSSVLEYSLLPKVERLSSDTDVNDKNVHIQLDNILVKGEVGQDTKLKGLIHESHNMLVQIEKLEQVSKMKSRKIDYNNTLWISLSSLFPPFYLIKSIENPSSLMPLKCFGINNLHFFSLSINHQSMMMTLLL